MASLLSRPRAFLRRLAVSGLATAAAGARDQLAVAHVLADAPTDGAGKHKVLLFPMGEVVTRDGRRYVLEGLAHAERVITASAAYAGKRDIPADYDHQLVYGVGAGKGGQAPASGWIKPASLTADEAGIWGEVEWTATAATRLANREYRYVSPSFTHDAQGRITSIRFLSLVNDNAIDDLPAVASTDLSTPEHDMDLSKIAAALGLPASATVEDIMAAIARMAMPAAAMSTAATALGLSADATAEQIATAAATAASAQPDPAKFAPVAALEAANARLATLEAERRERIVTTATEAGKLTPAERDWAMSYLAKDETGFTAMIAARPAIVTPGETVADPLATAASQHGLTADELTVATRMGLSAEAFANAKKG